MVVVSSGGSAKTGTGIEHASSSSLSDILLLFARNVSVDFSLSFRFRREDFDGPGCELAETLLGELVLAMGTASDVSRNFLTTSNSSCCFDETRLQTLARSSSEQVTGSRFSSRHKSKYFLARAARLR